MWNRMKSRSGYTMLEILTIVAIIGILSAIAMQFYKKYQNKARNADVISAWENIDNSLMAYYASDLHQGEIVCQDMVTVLPDHVLENRYVNLSIGFDQADPQEVRPVLNICANSSKPASFQVARLAHAYFQDLNRVGGGAVLKDSLISFSVPLQGDMTCAAPIPAPSGACLGRNTGSAVARPPQAPAPGNKQNQNNPAVTGPQTSTPQPPAGGPLTCGPDQEVVSQLVNGATRQVCAAKCTASQVRDPGNPLGCVDKPLPQGSTSTAQQPVTPPASTGSSTPAGTQQQSGGRSSDGCPPGREQVTLHHGHNYYQVCAPTCPPGTRRSSGNNLRCI